MQVHVRLRLLRHVTFPGFHKLQKFYDSSCLSRDVKARDVAQVS